MRRFTPAALAPAVVLAALFCAQSALAATYKEQVINVATANPPDSQHDIPLQEIKRVMEEESGGAIQVKILLNSAMGDEQTNVQQLRTGELHMTTVFTGNMTPAAPILNILSLPYFFATLDDAARLFNNKPYMNKLADIVAKQSSARPLGWILGGYRHMMNNKHRILKMTDLQGIRMRVSPAPAQLEAFRAWGIDPIPMAWTEVFSALQQGVIDGQENPFFTIRDNKFWEVQKYVTELHYILWTGPIAVSEVWYQGLDADTKALLEKAVQLAQDKEWEWITNQEETCKQLAIEHDMIVDVLTDEAEWEAAARAIWPKFHDLIGDTTMIDEALAIMQGK